MPTFEYHARNREGKKIHGQRLAQSSALLGVQLLKEGVTPVTILPVSEKPDHLATLKKWLPSQSLTTDDKSMFARQMHALILTGVPVTLALRQLAENARSARLSKILNGLVEKVESGHSLAAAMQFWPDFFTPVIISMVRMGEASGQLDESFLRLNQYLELEGAALKKAKAALRYPGFVLLTLAVAFVVVSGWVIPTFARVFRNAHLALPLPTRGLIAISDFCSHYGIWLGALLVLLIASLIYYLRTPVGRYQWGKLQLNLPVLGKIIRRIVLLRFTQTFSIAVSSGVSLTEGITLSAETTDNQYARSEILSLRHSIERGLNLTGAIAASPLFTSLEIQMLGISEQTGQLSTLLDQIAGYYQREVEYDLKRLNDIMEPVIMAALAVLVALMAFSVYLPIWNMVQLAHQ